MQWLRNEAVYCSPIGVVSRWRYTLQRIQDCSTANPSGRHVTKNTWNTHWEWPRPKLCPGIKLEIVTDSGLQFASDCFKKFAKHYEFVHSKISPMYSQSNSQVERFVQTVKQMFRRADDVQLALLNYRNAPLEVIGLSPAWLMFNRSIRS